MYHRKHDARNSCFLAAREQLMHLSVVSTEIWFLTSDVRKFTIAHWVCRYVRFHGLRHPLQMGAPEINAFLTHLARGLNVSANTQNQARCSTSGTF